MIVGNGDIAQALKGLDRDDVVFFASGVSDSSCTDEKEFERERELLLKQPREKRLIYFSSLCIYYSASKYAEHKWNMEQLIEREFRYRSIVRVGNITWGDNPKTLINTLRRCTKRPRIDPVVRFVVNEEVFRAGMQIVLATRPIEFNMNGVRMMVEDINETIKAGRL